MTERYSNMMSQRYCKACGSFAIERIHRGFFKKRILKTPTLYQCSDCGQKIASNDFNENQAKKVPMFIGQ